VAEAVFVDKRNNFNRAIRGFVFRYGISGRGCDLNGDGQIDSGGWGEVRGNDFIEYNHNGGTIMHELGHNLGLLHGGNVKANCKPNYVSVMNYDNQSSIRQVGGGGILDYSPPRFFNEDGAGTGSCGDGRDNGGDGLTDAADPDCVGRGRAPLPQLVENNLNESIILDATDAGNRFVFTNPAGMKVQWNLGGDNDGDGPGDGNGNGIGDGVNWNGDMDTSDSGLTVNIDTNAPCAANTVTNSTLTGYDDWTNISLPFRQFGESADSAINPTTEPEPTLQELIELEQELNTTDLSIAKTSAPDPVEVGADLVYTLRVSNKGPNPASRVRVVDTLPSRVSYRSNTAGCVEAPVGTLTCDLGEVPFGAERQLAITVGTAGVCEAGRPRPIAETASVANVAQFAGPDLNSSDNLMTVTATPVDTTPPKIESLGARPNTLWPPDHRMVPVTASVAASDICDTASKCQIVSVSSNEPVNGLGDGDKAPDWQITGDLTVNLRAERSGSGPGRTYTITVQCTDTSGNNSTKTVAVTVPHDQK
jgi:uncharacterized repeat protein (TIGR01451 family)